VDAKQAEKMQQKLLDNEFTLEDFRDQLRQISKLGPIENLLKMMPASIPGMGNLTGAMKDAKVDQKEFSRVIAIIDSMTPKERNNHALINGQRRRRIAKGSGTSVEQVNQVLKQYQDMRLMMKKLQGGLTSGVLGKRLGKMKNPFGGGFPGLGR